MFYSIHASGWQGIQPWSWDQDGEQVTYMKEALLCHRDWESCASGSSTFRLKEVHQEESGGEQMVFE